MAAFDALFEPIARIADAGGPTKISIDAGLGESGVLRKEPVARMHGIGADANGHAQDLRDIKITFRRRRSPQVVRLIGVAHMARPGVGIGVHRDAGEPQPPRRPRDAADDFAAVGDQ
jgi:hypothetical protein